MNGDDAIHFFPVFNDFFIFIFNYNPLFFLLLWRCAKINWFDEFSILYIFSIKFISPSVASLSRTETQCCLYESQVKQINECEQKKMKKWTVKKGATRSIWIKINARIKLRLMQKNSLLNTDRRNVVQFIILAISAHNVTHIVSILKLITKLCAFFFKKNFFLSFIFLQSEWEWIDQRIFQCSVSLALARITYTNVCSTTSAAKMSQFLWANAFDEQRRHLAIGYGQYVVQKNPILAFSNHASHITKTKTKTKHYFIPSSNL